jgi:hypothetical protein
MAATVSEPNSAMVSSTDGPHRPRCRAIVARTVPRLDRQRDVVQLVPDAAGAGEQQVDRLALARAVHPDQPRPAAVAAAAQVHHRGRRPAETDAGKRRRERGLVLERQLLVGQLTEPATSNGFLPEGLR